MLVDFTTYTEDDPLNRLSQTATRSTWTGMTRGDIETALWKDYGAGNLGLAWTYQFMLHLTQVEAGDADSRFLCACIGADNVPGASEPSAVNRAYIYVVEDGNNDDKFTLDIVIATAVINEFDISVVLDAGVDYYITWIRSNAGKTCTATIRTGSHAGPIVDTISVTHVDFNNTFRYMKAPQKQDFAQDVGDWSTGYVENLATPSEDLLCAFIVIGEHSADLFAKFEVGQGSEELYAEFMVRRGLTDFTFWTESDGAGRLSQTIPRSTFTGLRRSDNEVYLSRDFGAAHFSDFFHEFDLRITAIEVTTRVWRASCYTISKVLGDWVFLRDNNHEALSLHVNNPAELADKFYISIRELKDGVSWATVFATILDTGTTYYFKVSKHGTSLLVEIYSDSARTTLIESQSHTLQEDYTYRYLMIPESLDYTQVEAVSGYVEYLELDASVSRDLPAEFEVGQGAEDLLAEFVVRHETIVDLPGEFVIRRAAIRDLPAEFEVGQGAADLAAEFTIPGESWLAGWLYRKSHKITGSTVGAQTDYQIGVKVYYGAGVDGTETVNGVTFGKIYCDSKCKTDFGDIRLTSWDGITEIDYWLQEKSDSSYALFWVEVPFIPASPAQTTIYVYYGEPPASTTSDGDATFPWFDHFDDGDITTDYDIQQQVQDTVTEAGTLLTITSSHIPLSHWTYLTKKVALSINHLCFVAYVKRAQWDQGWEFMLEVVDSFITDGGIFFQDKNGNIRRLQERDGGGGLVDNVDDVNLINDNNYHVINLYYRYDIGVKADYDGGAVITNAFAAPRESSPKLLFGQSVFTAASWNNSSEWDWIFARKYESPEPAHGTWGSEEVQETSVDLLAYFSVAAISSGSEDLPGEFIARHEASADLAAQFSVGVLTGSQDLLGEFSVQHEASVKLLGKFEAQVTAELLGKTEIKNIGSTELLGKIEIRNIGSAELLGNAIIRHSDIAELLGKFEAQVTAELLGKTEIKNIGSTELLGKIEIRNIGSAELLGKVVIRHVGTPVEFLGKAVIRHVGTPLEVLGKFVTRHSDYAEFLSKFEVGQDSADLLGHFDVGQDSVDFPARFEVGQGAEGLPGRAIIRHSASSDLKFSLYVSPWYLTAAEMLIGGRDRRMDLGGLDREMVIGGRKRRMKIK